MPAIIQRLKADNRRYILVDTSTKESEMQEKLKKEKEQGHFSFIEHSKAKWANGKVHDRWNVWRRLED